MEPDTPSKLEVDCSSASESADTDVFIASPMVIAPSFAPDACPSACVTAACASPSSLFELSTSVRADLVSAA